MLSRDGLAGHVVVMQALAAEKSLLLHLKDQTAGEYDFECSRQTEITWSYRPSFTVVFATGGLRAYDR